MIDDAERNDVEPHAEAPSVVRVGGRSTAAARRYADGEDREFSRRTVGQVQPTEAGQQRFISPTGTLRDSSSVFFRATTHGGLIETATEGSLGSSMQEMLTSRRKDELDTALAVDDEIGLFLLHKIAESGDGVLLDQLDVNLSGYGGWLPLARLLSASLISENGRRVFLTHRGAGLLMDLEDSSAYVRPE